MGFFKKVFRPVRKIAKKIIPKEIRPFLPYAAAMIPGAQGLASLSFMNPAAQKALFAGITSAATDEEGNPLRAAALAAAPDVLSKGLGAVGTKLGVPGGVDVEGTMTFAERIGEGARSAQGAIGRTSPLKIAAAQTAIDSSAKFAEIRQDEIDEYNRSLQEQGVLDKTKRRTAIFNIYKNAGYEDDYVNSMLDRYGYDDGGEVKDIPGKGKKTGIEKIFEKLNEKKDDDEDTSKNLAGGLMAAAEGVEKAFGRGFGEVEPVPMLRFARGGEVEIEEQVDDLGIMDLMKDQGIPYGEQASYGFDDAMGETFEMFLDYKKKGTIPMEMEFDEFLELLQGRKEQGIKGTQVASGYKDDIEEMYEQYVFEMEEQGLEPMDFASFLRQARSGMANGGKVKRRKKGEPADEVIETEEEIFLDKMPRPKRKGIMEAAGGGSVGSRYSFLINKQKQGILSPDEEQELLMLEMTYADESQGKADGGIMNKNLLNTGVDKDMRGGGFIPEGTKEKADDVPARLSKNEFVMTADAVRAAGGGSVNKGAKKMYDLMYTLEAKV